MKGFEALQNITFQQINIFLAAAKYENFTKAADELYITEASVSRNISNMETALGLVLFIRHRKRVKLTNAGKGLQEALKRLEKQLTKALEEAWALQRNQFHRLNIADQSMTDMDVYMLPLTRAFEERYPEVELILERDLPFTVRDNLLAGRYDAIFSISYGVENFIPRDMAILPLFHLEPCIVLADTHPLFAKDDLTLEELRACPLAAMRGGLYEYYWEFASSVAQQFALRTDDVKFDTNEASLALTLRQGRRIAVMDRLFSPYGRDSIRYFSLENSTACSGISLIYSKNNENPYLRKFIDICVETTPELIRRAY